MITTVVALARRHFYLPLQSYDTMALLQMYLLASMASRCRRLILFSFLTPLRSLNESQPNLDTYSLMTAMWKFGQNFPGHSLHTGRGQKRFFGTDFQLWPNMYLYNGMKLVNRDSSTCPPNLEDYSNFFSRIYGGKNSATDSASRIFFWLIFGGQNSAANSNIQRRLGGLIQPFKRCTFWPISNLVSWCPTM